MYYKPDFEQTKEHFKAWWAHEYFGRCAISVKSPKRVITGYKPVLPESVEDRWLNFEYLAEMNQYKMSNTFYGGEAFPIWNPGYPGCDGLAVYLGVPVVLSETTGWHKPIIHKGTLTDHDYHDLKINENGRWWNFGRDVLMLAVRESAGKSIPGNNAFGGCGDTLATLRGSEQLLYDMIDCPDYIREFELYLMKLWFEVFNRNFTITHEAAQGSTCWFELWAPGKFYASQCDFAYMISPKSFIDVFLPVIEMQTKFLDYTIHHVDGIGHFAHIDALLELPRLQAFQILPGAGKPSPLFYLDELRKVQSAGKNLHISINPDEIRLALDLLSARGLFIDTQCETEDEANELLKCVEKWSVDRG